MSYSPSSPLTGASQSDLTSPTYTLSADTAPDSNGIQHAVTALGGTQTGVDTHSVSKPFTLTAVRPKTLKLLGSVNPVTGVISQVPMNRWKIITRKGVSPLAGQANRVMLITTTIEVPAGADEADAANVQAGLSAHFGLVNDQSSGLGDTVQSGIL